MKVLIITGGRFDKNTAKEYLNSHEFDYVITADGGTAYAKSIGIMPDLLLGDFDTLKAEVLEEYKNKGIELMRFPTKKDYTDTHLALKTALEKQPDDIVILGGIGTRMDHTLANIGLLTLALEQGVSAQIIDSNNRIRMIKDSLVLEKKDAFGNYVSLIPYTEKVTGIDLEGFLYPLHDAELCIGISQGISNELVEEQGKISIKSGQLLVIESRD